MTDASALRDRVLDAAVELFAEQGYDGTSVSQVVSRAGVAKGGFYHHFASKEALLYEVYGDLVTRQLTALDEIRARGLPAVETLRALIRDLVLSTAANERRALVFWHEMHRLGGERTAQYRRHRRRYHDAVEQLVSDGQDRGDFGRLASAATITMTIFGFVNEMPLRSRPAAGGSPTQQADELADLVLSALAVRGP